MPGAAVTLFTGCGTDTDVERYWCNSDSAVWNNGGDTVFLRARRHRRLPLVLTAPGALQRWAWLHTSNREHRS